MNHHKRMEMAHGYPVGSGLGLLAVAVIGAAVDDARHGRGVVLARSWLDLADVDPKLPESAGVVVDHELRLRWYSW